MGSQIKALSVAMFMIPVTGPPLPGALPAAAEDGQHWKSAAAEKGAMTPAETRRFMKRLGEFVYTHHLKKVADSPQRGIVYEYFNVARAGEFDQFIQGEALDTMHDGAWFAAAMVSATRTAGDPFYRNFLTEWILPFYCRMLNHSDELFRADRSDARPGAHMFPKTHRLQAGEKGFVPYWWDDGFSVSLERRVDKNPLGAFECVDRLAGTPNPQYRLDGYSLGMSNHMAQDLGVMVQLAWLLLKDSQAPADRALAAETAEAAMNLHECRMRHHGSIPMCVAPAALANADPQLMRRVPDLGNDWTPDNHYVKALYTFTPGRSFPTPAFADDLQYKYYYTLAKHGGRLPRAAAFQVVYDAYTEPMLWQYFCDDLEVPPGINRGEYGLSMVNGAFGYYHSDKQGVRFLGSRMGPQNMIACGWALQILREYPGIWDARYHARFSDDLRVAIVDEPEKDNGGSAPPDSAFTEQFPLAAVGLRLAATPEALHVRGIVEAHGLTMQLYSRPDRGGTHATIVLDGESKTFFAQNREGESLKIDGTMTAGEQGMTFGLSIPWTVVKGQGVWANGIEHGRYAIAIGDESRDFYLISPVERVRHWLERELGEGLRTWEAILDAYGYIPTHLGRNPFWDGLSDSGGYAHLISAGAQWLLYLEGKVDWKMHNVPETERPVVDE